MSRTLAGSFGASGSLERAVSAVGGRAQTFADGPCRAAWTGAPAHDDGGVVCVLSGLISNLQAVSDELSLPLGAGAEAVLAASYRASPDDFPARLRGDFVALVWDRERGHGALVRDHLGGESLFLLEDGPTLYFASEIATMLVMLPHRPAPDHEYLAHWLALRNARGRTAYAGIVPLRPAHLISLRPNAVRARRYWQPAYSRPIEAAVEDVAGRVHDALELAVARVSGESSGVLISGGLDSSTVAALAEPRPRGYALTFPAQPRVDESSWLGVVANDLGLQGCQLALDQGSMLRGALECVSVWEAPLGPQNLRYFPPLVRAAAEDGVDVLLDGEGGDLLFGAPHELIADRIRRGSVSGAISLARRLPGAGEHPSRRLLAKAVLKYGVRASLPAFVQSALPGEGHPEWLRSGARKLVDDRAAALHWARGNGPRWWVRRVDAIDNALEAICVREWLRRRAATGGLRAASPFFDVDLVELVLRLPPELAFDPHRDRPLLREAAAGRLPESLRLRIGKAYFNDLMVAALAGPDRSFLVRLLGAPDAEIGAWVELGSMRRAILERSPRDHPGGAWTWAMRAWRLATAECWLRQQRDRSFATRELEGAGLPAPQFTRARLGGV